MIAACAIIGADSGNGHARIAHRDRPPQDSLRRAESELGPYFLLLFFDGTRLRLDVLRSAEESVWQRKLSQELEDKRRILDGLMQLQSENNMSRVEAYQNKQQAK